MDSYDIKDIKNCTYIFANAAGGLIEALGMISENMERDMRGDQIAYTGDTFRKLMEERGLHHNAILRVFEW